MVLALHVLTAAGFGSFHPFKGGLQGRVAGYNMTYRDALSMLMLNIVLAITAASIPLPSWALPRKFRQIRLAIDNFKRYMAEMLGREKAAIAMGNPQGNNLMSSLIRASEMSRILDKGRNALSDEEIFGNLFAHNLAGHETTSNTLAFAFALLAAHPRWQRWVAEEIDREIGREEDGLDDYETAFPRLKRCLAIMVLSFSSFQNASTISTDLTRTNSSKRYDSSVQPKQSRKRQHLIRPLSLVARHTTSQPGHRST